MRILLCGDTSGVAQLVDHVPAENIVGIIAASIRPQYLMELTSIAKKAKVPIFIQPKWKSCDYVDFKGKINEICPDIMLVNSYSMIIREDILTVPRIGGLNVHAALLPRNRGCNPTQWAILNKEFETGVTLHEMDSGLDTGPIVDQIKIPIFFHDTWLDIRGREAQATNDLLKSNLPQILSGSWKAVPQQNKNASTGRRRTPKDGEFFWSEKIVDIHNKIRALVPPLPPAHYLQDDGRRIEVDKYLTPWKLASYKYDSAIGGQSIKSDSANLIPLQKKDAKLFFDCLTDRELGTYNAPSNSNSVQELGVWVESMISECPELVVFVIESIEDKNTVGVCKLLNIDWRNRNAKLRIRIGTAFPVSQDFESEVLKILCRFAFEELGLRNLNTQVFAKDSKKVKSYEKIGFVKEPLPEEASLSLVSGHGDDFLQLSKSRG